MHVCMCAIAHVWGSEGNLEVVLISSNVGLLVSNLGQMDDIYHIKADLLAILSQHPSVPTRYRVWLALSDP